MMSRTRRPDRDLTQRLEQPIRRRPAHGAHGCHGVHLPVEAVFRVGRRIGALMTVRRNILSAMTALYVHVEWTSEEFSELLPSRAVIQNVDAAAVPTQTRRRLQQVVTDTVAIEVNRYPHDRLRVVVVEIRGSCTTNVGWHVDRNGALLRKSPGRLRRSLRVSKVREGRGASQDHEDKPYDIPHPACYWFPLKCATSFSFSSHAYSSRSGAAPSPLATSKNAVFG